MESFGLSHEDALDKDQLKPTVTGKTANPGLPGSGR